MGGGGILTETIERDDRPPVGGTTAWMAYNEPQHSWARIPGSASRCKMSDSKQGI